jgi:glycosyltransferase involved in cell wall biosynthesis
MNSKKRILHVLYGGLGGHGNVFFSFVDGDKEKIYEYAALFNGIESLKTEYIEKCRERDIGYSYAAKKQGLDIGFFLKTYKLIRKAKPDIIFLHSPFCILPAWMYRIRTWGRCRVVVREAQSNHLKTRQDWFWLYLAMLGANRIVFLSQQFREDVKRKMGWFYRKRKSRVIPNGIDLDVYKPGLKPSTLANRFVMGMQSRLERNKDHITLLQAFAKLREETFFPELYLRIAGDGTTRKELEELSFKLAIADKVQFTGMLDENELVPFLQSLDLYVHASKGEAMSTAIMQAMACKLPVIGSDVKGVNNMVSNNASGILVPVHDATALSAAIKLLYMNKDLRDKLAGKAYDMATELFSNKRMFREYQKVFENT